MELTTTIDELAATLIDSAIWHGDRCCWLAPTLTGDADGSDWSAVEVTGDPQLYDGSAGIAVACAAVGAMTTVERPGLVDIAAGAVRHAVDRALGLEALGLYDGLSGIGLAALAVGTSIDDADTRREGERLLELAAQRALATPPLSCDLVSGIAGIVVGLGRAPEFGDPPRWAAPLDELAQLLARRANRRPWGASWRDEPGWGRDLDEPDLCGLAHGVSGPLLALGIADTALGAPRRYGDLIRAGRQYERSWFDPARNAWPDLRDWSGSGAPPTPARWCHGATGIGLARAGLAGLDGSSDEDVRLALLGELGSAIQSTCAEAVDELDGAGARGLDAGLSLCHGLGGALDLLCESAALLDEPVHLDTACHLARRAIEALGDDVARWPGGVRGLPSPGLMNGTAGVLAVLARLEAPHELGSAGLLRVLVPAGVPPRREESRP